MVSLGGDRIRSISDLTPVQAPEIERTQDDYPPFADFTPTQYRFQDGTFPRICPPWEGQEIREAYIIYASGSGKPLRRARVAFSRKLKRTIVSQSFALHRELRQLISTPGVKSSIQTPYGPVDGNEKIVLDLRLSAIHYGIRSDDYSYSAMVLPFDMEGFDMIICEADLQKICSRQLEFDCRFKSYQLDFINNDSQTKPHSPLAPSRNYRLANIALATEESQTMDHRTASLQQQPPFRPTITGNQWNGHSAYSQDPSSGPGQHWPLSNDSGSGMYSNLTPRTPIGSGHNQTSAASGVSLGGPSHSSQPHSFVASWKPKVVAFPSQLNQPPHNHNFFTGSFPASWSQVDSTGASQSNYESSSSWSEPGAWLNPTAESLTPFANMAQQVEEDLSITQSTSSGVFGSEAPAQQPGYRQSLPAPPVPLDHDGCRVGSPTSTDHEGFGNFHANCVEVTARISQPLKYYGDQEAQMSSILSSQAVQDLGHPGPSAPGRFYTNA